MQTDTQETVEKQSSRPEISFAMGPFGSSPHGLSRSRDILRANIDTLRHYQPVIAGSALFEALGRLTGMLRSDRNPTVALLATLTVPEALALDNIRLCQDVGRARAKLLHDIGRLQKATRATNLHSVERRDQADAPAETTDAPAEP